MKRVIIVIAATIVVAGLAVVLLLPQQEITVPSTADHAFIIDVPMERVRKILVRTNAAKKIVAMSGAELKGQKWLEMDFEMPGKILDRNWHVDGQGKLEVLIKDDYIGDNRVTLNQKVDITRQRLEVTNVIDQPVNSVRNYDSSLTLIPSDAGNAAFDSRLTLEIRTTANWLFKGVVEKQIRSAALKSLQRQEQAIREIVESQSGKLLILPGQSDDN